MRNPAKSKNVFLKKYLIHTCHTYHFAYFSNTRKHIDSNLLLTVGTSAGSLNEL